MNPVVNQTNALTKIITPMTICCNGIAACKRSIPFPTTLMIGIAMSPAATVIEISLTKSAVGSAEDHVSIGYIIFSANVAPDLDRPMMYKKPRTITVTAVLTADRIAITSRSCFVCGPSTPPSASDSAISRSSSSVISVSLRVSQSMPYPSLPWTLAATFLPPITNTVA